VPEHKQKSNKVKKKNSNSNSSNSNNSSGEDVVPFLCSQLSLDCLNCTCDYDCQYGAIRYYIYLFILLSSMVTPRPLREPPVKIVSLVPY
jgi:hypothetical protein